VLRDVLRTEQALRNLLATEQWKVALRDSPALKKAHAQISSVENDIFQMGKKVEDLLGPVMDAIHQFEADQPMLPFVFGWWQKLLAHAALFADNNPKLNKGQVPPDRRKKDRRPSNITLTQVWEQDRDKMWHPAITAAAILDPLFFTKNVRGRFRVPIADLSEADRDNVLKIVQYFEKEGEDADEEEAYLETSSFEPRYSKVLERLAAKSEVKQGRHTVVQVTPHSERVDFYNNVVGTRVPAVTRAVNVLLSMPVTACAAERNWSKWGATFAPNRNALGLEVAQNMIFVQQNDPATRCSAPDADVLVE
jgi:hypothetical protein